MPLFLADFLLSATSPAYEKYIGPNSPRIGIQNFATEGNVSSTDLGSVPTNPPALAANTSMDERWKSQGLPSHIFRIEFGEENPRLVDYIGMVGMRGMIGRQVRFALRKNGSTVFLIDPLMITTSAPIFKMFDAVECDAVFAIFESDGSNFDVDVAYIAAGQTVALPRKVYVGHSPVPYARNVRSRFNVSDNGTFLGQESVSVQLRSSVNISNVPPDYYRDILYPNFQRPAESTPFFWAWRPGDYPSEVAFCWLPDGQCRVSNEKPNGFMSFGFDLVGIPND